jgi:hypothetical protein
MVPNVLGVTTILIVAVAALANVPRLQVIAVVPLQLPWVVSMGGVSVTPEGNVSVTVTPVAVLGPLLVTVIV